MMIPFLFVSVAPDEFQRVTVEMGRCDFRRQLILRYGLIEKIYPY